MSTPQPFSNNPIHPHFSQQPTWTRVLYVYQCDLTKQQHCDLNSNHFGSPLTRRIPAIIEGRKKRQVVVGQKQVEKKIS